MPEFLRLTAPAEARKLVLDSLPSSLMQSEAVDTALALHRITSEDVLSPHALPEFARSTVDGYAVQARDTFGASASSPSYIQLSGEIPMGATPQIAIQTGRCAVIHTGGMVPEGADAVVMLEHAQQSMGESANVSQSLEIEVLKPVAPGENIIAVGEDVGEGEVVIRKGVRLRAQELGGLLALGLTSLRVVRKPRVSILSSGDEVVAPDTRPQLGQVRDVNASTLSALLSDAGALPVFRGVVPDDLAQLEEASRIALGESDAVVITAGSSASARDLTATAITALGAPGVLVHGINIRPGKPTILGLCDGKPVVGLPGNPVSALIIGRLFLIPIVFKLLGLREEMPRPTILARLSVNLTSQTGREDWWPVRITHGESGETTWRAEPVFGRSNLIFTLVAAQGLLRVPAAASGLNAGDTVEVEIL